MLIVLILLKIIIRHIDNINMNFCTTYSLNNCDYFSFNEIWKSLLCPCKPLIYFIIVFSSHKGLRGTISQNELLRIYNLSWSLLVECALNRLDTFLKITRSIPSFGTDITWFSEEEEGWHHNHWAVAVDQTGVVARQGCGGLLLCTSCARLHFMNK